MIHIGTKIPHKVGIAFSGGVDSLAVAHFLKQGKKDITLYHFWHGCDYSDQIEEECREHAHNLGLPIVVGRIHDKNIPAGKSKEDYWRRARYRFLRSFEEETIITAHHLNDAMETWLFTSLNGEGKLIPVESGNIIRPFLMTEKAEFENYAARHGLEAVFDFYNTDLDLTRNFIRHNMMPLALKVNPGLGTVIRKKYMSL